jgi:hypothetical protein
VEVLYRISSFESCIAYMLALHGQYSMGSGMLACRALRLECLLNGIFCFGNFYGRKADEIAEGGRAGDWKYTLVVLQMAY